MSEVKEGKLLSPSLSNAQYNIYKELLRLYHHNNNGEEAPLTFRLLRRLLNNLVSSNGWDIATFFHNHTAATKPEIQKVTHINWQGVNTTVNTLVETGFLKVLGRVGLPYRTRGRPIPIYGLHHATAEDATRAQKRYGELRRSEKNPRGQRQITEAIALAKTYMEDRGLRAIPDRSILAPILRESGIRVNYDHLTTALHKEGYRL